MLCSPVIVSLLYQLVHLRWVDHGRQDTQRPWVGHCWCWQLLQTILYVLSILYYISSPVCVEVLYVDVCVLVHFPVGQLAESKGLVLTWGPFTVNLTPLRGQDRAAFCFFWFNLVVWHKAQCSSHCTTSLRMAVNVSEKKLFIKMLNEVLQNHHQGYQLILLQLSFL